MERGLGSLGVLALFTLLAVLLGVSLPVIKSDAPLKASDWLGFAGNIIAAVFAAVAAVVAWVAAQRQIRQATRQNAVIAYGALKDTLAAINSDIIVVDKLHLDLEMVKSDLRVFDDPRVLSLAEQEIVFAQVRNRLNDLDSSERKLSEQRANPWGGPKERDIREGIITTVSSYVALSRIRADVANMEPLKPTPSDKLAAMFSSDLVDEAIRACEEFGKVSNREMANVYHLMDMHFESVTIHS